MELKPTTVSNASASGGAAGALMVVIMWGLSLVNIAVPAEVASSLTVLVTVGIHFVATKFSKEPIV